MTTTEAIARWPDGPFFQMATVLPEGSRGTAAIKHWRCDTPPIRGYAHPDEFVSPGTYAQLRINGALWMSDTDMERRTNRAVVRQARGDVLIAGLGLGLIVLPIALKPEVISVTIVERSQDVIELIYPTLREHLDPRKICIVDADIMQWRPARGVLYDVIYFDIWQGIGTDNLGQMGSLHRAFARRKNPGGWMESWQRATLQERRRRFQQGGY